MSMPLGADAMLPPVVGQSQVGRDDAFTADVFATADRIPLKLMMAHQATVWTVQPGSLPPVPVDYPHQKNSILVNQVSVPTERAEDVLNAGDRAAHRQNYNDLQFPPSSEA